MLCLSANNWLPVKESMSQPAGAPASIGDVVPAGRLYQ